MPPGVKVESGNFSNLSESVRSSIDSNVRPPKILKTVKEENSNDTKISPSQFIASMMLTTEGCYKHFSHNNFTSEY